MPDLCAQKLQVVFEALLLDCGVCGGVEPGALSAVAHVDLINVLHELCGLITADILVEVSAELVGYVVLAIRKSSRSAESAHYGAHRAVDAGLYLLAVDGAPAICQLCALFEAGDPGLGVVLYQLIRRKDPAGAGADYYNVVMFHFSSYSKGRGAADVLRHPGSRS